ncbi:MAG TPA: HEAT repeat domain-containing protein [Trichocoleus sp.]
MLYSFRIASLTLALSSLGLTALTQIESTVAAIPLSNTSFILAPQSSQCGHLPTESKISCLTRNLQSSDNLLRRFAAWELGELGEVAIEASPYLINVLREDQGKWERVHACIALGKIGLPITEVLPSLRLILEDPDSDIRSCAATSLGMVAVKIQNIFNDNNLSQADLDTAVSELEETLQVLQAPNADFNTEPIERVETSLNILKTRTN